jgi:hypothetical protein
MGPGGARTVPGGRTGRRCGPVVPFRHGRHQDIRQRPAPARRAGASHALLGSRTLGERVGAARAQGGGVPAHRLLQAARRAQPAAPLPARNGSAASSRCRPAIMRRPWRTARPSSGVHAVVVMPEHGRRRRRSRRRGYGAEVVLHGDVFAAFANMDELRRTATRVIHPFDDPHVIAGQGTVGARDLRRRSDSTSSSSRSAAAASSPAIATAVRALRPRARIIGVEPDGRRRTRRALDAGAPVRLDAWTPSPTASAHRPPDPSSSSTSARSSTTSCSSMTQPSPRHSAFSSSAASCSSSPPALRPSPHCSPASCAYRAGARVVAVSERRQHRPAATAHSCYPRDARDARSFYR